MRGDYPDVTWERISCEEYETALRMPGGLHVLNGLTDLHGTYRPDPVVETIWGTPDGKPVLHTIRHPAPFPEGDDDHSPCPDRLPCEHYAAR